MKCQARVDGGICETEIPPNAKFCSKCGSKVVKSEDTVTCACPNCSELVKRGQNFCTSCRWRVDPKIFEETKIFCKGINDGKVCGAVLLPSMKFCPECGTKCSISPLKAEETKAGERQSIQFEVQYSIKQEGNTVDDDDEMCMASSGRQSGFVNNHEIASDAAEGMDCDITSSDSTLVPHEGDQNCLENTNPPVLPVVTKSDPIKPHPLMQHKSLPISGGKEDKEISSDESSKDSQQYAVVGQAKRKDLVTKFQTQVSIEDSKESDSQGEEIGPASEGKDSQNQEGQPKNQGSPVLKRENRMLSGDDNHDQGSEDNTDDSEKNEENEDEDDEGVDQDQPFDGNSQNGEISNKNNRMKKKKRKENKRRKGDDKTQETTNSPEKDLSFQKKDIKRTSQMAESNKSLTDSTSTTETEQPIKLKASTSSTTATSTVTTATPSTTKSAPSGGRKQAFAHVYFHIIVSPTILPDSNSGSVYIHFENQSLGGWNSKKHKMVFKRNLPEGFMKYQKEVRIPKEVLRNPLSYSYYVMKTDKEFIEEHVHINSSGSKDRIFSIQNEDCKDVHQYDCVVKQKLEKDQTKGIWKTVQGWITGDKLLEEAMFCFHHFLPTVQLTKSDTIGMVGEDIIYHIERIFDGLKTVYEFELNRSLQKKLHDYIVEVVKILDERKTVVSTEDQILHLAAAMNMVYLQESYKIDLKNSDMNKLCKALLPFLENGKTECPEYTSLNDYFHKTKTRISDALEKMVKNLARYHTQTCVFYCMPLMHFLKGKYTPYQPAPNATNHGDRIPEWWGIAEIKQEISYFQGKTSWDRSRNEVLQSLVPYFAVDYLLPRTFVASLTYHQFIGINLEHIPTDVILASVFYFVKQRQSSHQNLSSYGYEVNKVLEKVVLLLLKQSEDIKSLVEEPFRNFRIAADVLSCLYDTYGSKRSMLCLNSFEAFLISVDWLSKSIAFKESRGEKEPYRDHLYVCNDHKNRMIQTLCSEYNHGHEVDYLMLWNRAFSMRIPPGEIQTSTLDYMASALEEDLSIRFHETELKIIEIYCEQLGVFGDKMQETLSKFTFKVVETGSNFQCGSGMRGAALVNFGRLLSQVFERSMDLQQLSDQHKILSYTLNWAPFSTYVKIYCHDDYQKSLSHSSAEIMGTFVDVVKNACEDLVKGTILIKDLEIMMNKEEHFKSVVSEIKSITHSPEYLLETLSLRRTELDHYQHTLKVVQDFIHLCSQIHGNTTKLEEKIKTFERLESIQLNSLCKVSVLDDKSNQETKPVIVAFELEEDVLETIPYILQCSKGVLFRTLWDKKGHEVLNQKHKNLEIDEILKEVWQPTHQMWKDLSERLRSKNLKFSEFEKYFSRIANMETLKEELEKLISEGDSTWVDDFLEHLQKYRTIQSCLFVAKVIIDVVKEYELKGNFTQIADILTFMENADTKINTLDDRIPTCEILRGISEDEANCLKTFCQCKPLVDWLRTTMPSGLKELKVFVDLASISAGEGDYEIGKVNCLHAATTGYAPLIFNLDENCNALTFLGKCQEVWKELASDFKLPKKLIDTQRHLDWLKSVKQTHGSVEVTSLSQAEAINANGIYHVGNLKKTASIKNPTLSEVLELEVKETEGQRLQRNQYRYDQLHDLQSRLMLVAGKAEKGKDEVDRFMLVLDSVVRLGNIYTKLVAEGCVLFSQWHVEFLCDPKETAFAFINFGFGKDEKMLNVCNDNLKEDVSAIISKLAKFMEQCHQNWLEYLNGRREKYYVLNYFTIDQLVILQQELVKIGSKEEPSVLIYPLLSAVRHGCNKKNLVKAMADAKQDLESLDYSHLDDDAVTKFLQVITVSYPKELAKKALKHVSPEDIDAGLLWCMENTDLDDKSKDTSQFTGWTKSRHSLSSIIADLVSQLRVESSGNSVDKLMTALAELWQTFLNSISSSVSDYLSVEHLGLILNRLAEQEELIIDRTFQTSFTPGEPNLIICPQSEIYNMLLAVYSHEEDKPLPQHDEVLLCTPYTTLDMVEIFLRRALFADKNKVYCLVNSDLLDYDVSDRGERTLERLMKSAEIKGKKYRLVVICSSENEYKSRIVSSLDKFHRPKFQSMKNIKDYLLTKLRVENSQSEVIPACSVDFEKCTVRIVKSWRAGVGKTLYKKRMVADLNRMVPNIPRNMASNVTIPLHEKAINTDSIMDTFLKETLPPRCHEPRIFHIDISHEVQDGVDAFLFQLLVLGCLGHSSGHVWRKSDLDYYIIESMPLLIKGSDNELKCLHHCLEILPHVLCRSPQESLEILSDTKRPPDHDRLFDSIEFESAVFQRPFQYLKRLDTNCKLDDVDAHSPEGDKKQCLQTLLRHCGIRDPSWSELQHFVNFLNKQLEDFNNSTFCSVAVEEDLPGFAEFVLRFLIQMSRDFSTRSLKVSEESPIMMLEDDDENDNVTQQYQLKRKWETSPHPYLFFNPDQHSMTFLGFNIDRRTGNLIDQQTRTVLEQGIMKENLFDGLVSNKVNLRENFDNLPRVEKIRKLCNVMGLDVIHDPDDTYELTTDNVKKILAIYMRFRCDIPVIIMGETGCGKTRLIKFMCNLQQPPGVTVENMILMKVHGGTRVADIVRKVKKAEEIAQKNATDYPFMDTVLFFDEANTTEAIGVIKEIMCDKSLGGKPIKLHDKLKIVAACNPYRKHSEELIKRLEQAGLGYHVDADKTTDRLGREPMRRLVYRVQPLPQSMLPLVWDFGQLNTQVEEMYIRQMVLRYIRNGKLPPLLRLENVVSKILTVSQDFMRAQKDECSFVSLRDVERVLDVMSWFYRQSNEDNLLFRMMREESKSSEEEDELQISSNEEMETVFGQSNENNLEHLSKLSEQSESSDDEEGTESEAEQSSENYLEHLLMLSEQSESSDDEEGTESEAEQEINDITRSLVLALGVCYHACLKNRDEYREAVARHFGQPLVLPNGADQIKEEISRCQTVFLENVELAANIAKNQALKENVFMMIVCIELRIPMFLVGKPGSSKSLAKTVVADAMQGNAAHKDLFKNYKQAQMVSFQCSPISVPEGIVGTFRQCAAYQKEKDLDRFVSIVVLDEIGLAEDSPRMPLKTLHPLLEDGCLDDEDPEPFKKVAFIGISNWALDPAKMNRGILVQREVPDITELKETAEGICSTNQEVLILIKPIIEPLADSYLELFDRASKEMREFFGLRDFYSLLKMLYAFVSKSEIPSKLSWFQLKHAILRNFGGLEKVDPVKIFCSKLSTLVSTHEKRQEEDPDCTSAGMIQACLTGDATNSESRYLLLLTENYGALDILQQKIFTMHNTVIIFGSSFPSDQEYTQVCRNINRIKVCMETGSTVILLNLENLYESLYDALNQYYVEFGGERYVDLGLGSHRVKCRVHRSFRLIVVAEKQIVYNKFPIPLINRLEKHFLSLKTMLTPAQLELTNKLQSWAQDFCRSKVPAYLRKQKESCKIEDAFMGFNTDTCAAIIQNVCQEKQCDDATISQIEKEILHDAKSILLWCATPASVWQLNDHSVFQTYFIEQHHDSLADYLHYKLVPENKGNVYAQITTNSKLMSSADIEVLCNFIPIKREDITLLTLQSFDTEQQFSRQLKSCFDHKGAPDMLLIVQCDCGDQNAELVACARYTVQGELQQIPEDKVNGIHVVFLIQLPGIAGGCFSGFQCGLWHSVHIDELQLAPKEMPSISEMHDKSLSDLLTARQETRHVDTDIGSGNENASHENASQTVNGDLEAEPKRILKPQGQFNVRYLIKKCIQPALGNVKDGLTDSNKDIKRLTTVLKCINDSKEDPNFISGITEHLSSLLIEKEQNSPLATNWLSGEASKPGNINRAGTFRRFAVHCLESRVIPLLAGIVAFIDTNRNIDILTENIPWKTDIWMQIINDPKLTQLQYKLIVSPTLHRELEEVLVKTTSMDGKIFSSVMPFSWLIYQKIDEVLKNTMERSDANEDNYLNTIIKATETLQELPLGRLLSTVEGTYIHAVLKAYITDFVHMVYPLQSQEECDLICMSIKIGCKQLIQGDYDGRLLISLVGCHMSFIMHDTRLKNFSHIVHVWPDCCKKISEEFQKEEANVYLVTDQEVTLDILALHLLIVQLEPDKGALNQLESRTKWLQQVCDYRPFIERIFGHFNQIIENTEKEYGDICQKGVKTERTKWTRVLVVKLFIEHICSTDTDINNCMPLWSTFRDGADLKDINSLEKIEKFLRMCNKQVVNKLFGKQMECISCKNNLEGAPVRLPCDHILCSSCYHTMRSASKDLVCKSCYKQFPSNLDLNESENKIEIRKFMDYRQRCNSFFMEVVSQLCFAEGTPPSQEVIEKLLSYILGQTTKEVDCVVSRELTIFNDSIDPTPVVRSFLLQQLMQTSNHEIESDRQAYFNYAWKLVNTTGDNQQLVELCLLVLQCMEDFLHQQNASTDDEIATVTRFLKDACHTVTDPHVELLDKIEDISKERFALAVVAKHAHKLYGSTESSIPDPTVIKMFDQAAKLCEECGSQWPRRYFVKQLCRCFGLDSYHTVCKNDSSFLQWVRLPELEEKMVKECHDRYVVLGEEYKELRETIVTTVLNENSDKLHKLLQRPAHEWQMRIRLLLALHREITMNNVYGNQAKKIKDKGKAFLLDFCAGHTMMKNKDVFNRIVTNTLWRIPGNIDPGMDLADQNIVCLLTHYFILLTEVPGETTLLSPLQRISLQPESMVSSFYPTMPEDDATVFLEAIKATTSETNSKLYRCPNGHPYVITECGRAWTESVCPACGSKIGGKLHNLMEKNTEYKGEIIQLKETGHILGKADGTISTPVRNISRPAFAILRLLTHMSMYIGANIDGKEICKSVYPNVEEGEVATYLTEHIDLDLASVQDILGKNRDDVLVLIHFLLARVMDIHTMGVLSETLDDNVCRLLDKQSRAKWEEDFTNRYINPVLQEIDKVIKENNSKILNDERLGSDPLLQILYETDNPQTEQDITMLHEVPAVWRYRAMITVNHVHQNLEAETKELPILRLFFKEDHHLRAIRFVPSIIRLQKLLIQKYNKKLDRAEATTLKIEDVWEDMRQDQRSKEFEILLADYIEAWNCVRKSLDKFVFPVKETFVTIDEKYCRTEITDKTPISHLIPTHKDAGLSSYALLFFLLRKHNGFMEKFCSICKRKESSLPKVYVKDISSAHLISYHPDRDLLPLVLANCNYSFEVGQGTRVEYNYTKLERQLMDRFLFSKSIITSIQEIEIITYRSESTNGVVLKSLCNRGVQERLNPAVISQICSEVRLKPYPDLCESLDKLDIAISFLKSVGSEQESSLHEFMVNTLKIDSPFPSLKAQQTAKCKHLLSLWVTLASERAKALAKYHRTAFEGVSENFKKSLTAEQAKSVEELVTKLPTELIDELVNVVFECIVLKVDIPQNINEEDFVDMPEICLRDTLFGYVDACPFQGDLALHDALLETIYQLPSDTEDPNRVLTAHSVEVWRHLYQIYTSKQKQAS